MDNGIESAYMPNRVRVDVKKATMYVVVESGDNSYNDEYINTPRELKEFIQKLHDAGKQVWPGYDFEFRSIQPIDRKDESWESDY